MTHPSAKRICLGEISTAHGVRGLVRIRIYGDDPQSLMAYGPLFTTENGDKTLTVKLKREAVPPNIDLFRALQDFPIAAVANGGMGRNQAWITPNVRSFLSTVKDRSWDNGFQIPVDPWPF